MKAISSEQASDAQIEPEFSLSGVPQSKQVRFSPLVFLQRTFVIALASALLTACNMVQNRPAATVGVGDMAGSYTGHSSSKPHQNAAASRSKRGADPARQTVAYEGRERPGTIVIKTGERRLYFVLADGKALRYPVGVGRAGKQWQGRAQVDGKHVEPAWSPPDEVRRDNPRLPDVIQGGSPRNPMGPRALTLSGGGQYAIHGTNRPNTVGTFATYGCIRMYNEDILDLFDRVSIGTEVSVTS